MTGGGRIVEWTRVNGYMGDPAVYVFMPRTGDALLFDLGAIDALSNRDLLKVRAALVSHTHIDHFIGFDRWLRVNIPHFRELELAGPPGLIANVRGKLAGYTWNLLEPDQLRFAVHELAPDGTVTSVLLRNQSGFRPEELRRPEAPPQALDAGPPPAPGAAVVRLADGTRIDAVALDHGTPSIAYAIQAPCRFHVKTEELAALGRQPGPWIRDLQVGAADRSLSPEDAAIARRIFDLRRPKPFGYVTDIGFSAENVQRARIALAGVDLLVSETNFKDAERDRAVAKMHLTTRQAALLAAAVGATELAVFHVSNLYADDALAVAEEAEGFFKSFSGLDAAAIDAAVAAELAR